MAPKANALMVVDGYNVIGAKWDMTQGDLAQWRRELVENLCNYTALNPCQTHVIFDAHQRRQRETWEEITDQVRVCYTAYGLTADAYIERFCARHRGREQRLIVVTSDRLEWMTAAGYGAEWLSSPALWQAMAQQPRQQTPKGTAGRMNRGLPAAIQKRLRQWSNEL
ncbi:Putative RNA-binding protein containing a PIN domain [Gloeomargarita lithophora Alchichica-D10]|uniref:RNA-binding protein containing a PIN domain n=1 Tax=Gloeomargarita lithophora Alchichica-D10 TaxID=1188229 RepID=A0A1J0A9M7_9CYAN|nr:NYN domain-containing protein [Gloeomargarita lithophora]APB32627.1 Putative RNA-binding protein containing a PIN domain [Gloeomargarita lithophora Alchichica-D10]